MSGSLSDVEDACLRAWIRGRWQRLIALNEDKRSAWLMLRDQVAEFAKIDAETSAKLLKHLKEKEGLT
jgi:hypothetical protein